MRSSFAKIFWEHELREKRGVRGNVATVVEIQVPGTLASGEM